MLFSCFLLIMVSSSCPMVVFSLGHVPIVAFSLVPIMATHDIGSNLMFLHLLQDMVATTI
jgi:hypothetical protein